MPAAVTSIGDYAFYGCTGIQELHVPTGAANLGSSFVQQSVTIISAFDAPARAWALNSGNPWRHDVHTEEALPAVEPGCETAGLTEGSWCSVCGEIFVAQEEIPAIGHDWQAPAYAWSDDSSSVTAARVCAHNETHVETETVPATAEVTLQPACEADGEIVYTGAAFENEAFQVQTKTEVLPALDHAWGEVTYTWNEENTEVTATQICANDAWHDHVRTETVKVKREVTVSPTQSSEGEFRLVSEAFAQDGFIAQEKAGGVIPALGTQHTLTLPSDLRRIEAEAFEGLAFQTVVIPDTCTAIGSRAFANCRNLVYVYIPASVTDIAADAFDDCPNVIIEREAD